MTQRFNDYYLGLSAILALGTLFISIIVSVLVPFVEDAHYWQSVIMKLFTLIAASLFCWLYSFYKRFR